MDGGGGGGEWHAAVPHPLAPFSSNPRACDCWLVKARGYGKRDDAIGDNLNFGVAFVFWCVCAWCAFLG